MSDPLVTFVERSGPGARSALRALQERVSALGLPTRLLAGRHDPSLFLLVIDGDPVLADGEREGARTWRFREAAGADAPGGGS